MTIKTLINNIFTKSQPLPTKVPDHTVVYTRLINDTSFITELLRGGHGYAMIPSDTGSTLAESIHYLTNWLEVVEQGKRIKHPKPGMVHLVDWFTLDEELIMDPDALRRWLDLSEAWLCYSDGLSDVDINYMSSKVVNAGLIDIMSYLLVIKTNT